MRLKHSIIAALLVSVMALPALAQTTPAANAPAVTTQAKPAVTTPAPTTTAPAAKSALVNVNTATPAQLDALPGIGEARTKAIIAGRPYKSVGDLDTKKVIPHATFEKIKAQLTI